MLLSVFETVTSSHERSLSAWINHINGAAALIKVRGPEQQTSVGGLRMFMQAAINLMVSCLKMGMALPEHILALDAGVASMQSITNQHGATTKPWSYS